MEFYNQLYILQWKIIPEETLQMVKQVSRFAPEIQVLIMSHLYMIFL